MHNDGADCRQTIESRARYAGSSCTGKHAEGAHDPDVTENQFDSQRSQLSVQVLGLSCLHQLLLILYIGVQYSVYHAVRDGSADAFDSGA